MEELKSKCENLEKTVTDLQEQVRKLAFQNGISKKLFLDSDGVRYL